MVHGTHVAGTVGALDNDFGVVGVAPGVNLWAVRVLADDGYGAVSNVICGVDFVTGTRTDLDSTNDIAVANMSLGWKQVPWEFSDDCNNTTLDPMHVAVCNSVAKGIVNVAAAGNQAQDLSSYLMVPAAYDNVITASAIVDTDGKPGGIGPGSTYGSDDAFANFSNRGQDVDMAAPGVDIMSTIPGGNYDGVSGTSMASPHVTGAAALFIANNGTPRNSCEVNLLMNLIKDPANGYVTPQNSPNGYSIAGSFSYSEPLLFLPNGGVVPAYTPISNCTSSPSPTPTSTPGSSSVVISNISTSNITTNSATITWTTNTPATSRVSYGLKSNNLNLATPEDTNLVTSHSVNLTNLQRNKRYYFKVHSKNQAGLESSSSIQQFRTKNR